MTINQDTSPRELMQLLRRANPISAAEISALHLDAPFEDLLENITGSESAPSIEAPHRRRFSRRSVAVIAATTVLASTGGVAAAAWTSAHTGIFGRPGQTENDTSEFLDMSADDAPQLARQLAAGIPYPPGDSADSYLPGLRGTGLMQPTGVKAYLSIDAACAWEGYWLQARSAGNDARRVEAARVLARVPSWPAIASSDRGGVVSAYRQVAEAATANEPTRVQQDWTANCTGLPRHWAGK